MMEETIIERILLNLGGDAPEILVVFLIVRYVWPGMQDLLEQYLQGRTTAAATPAAPFAPATVTIVLDDSVGKVVDGLSAIVTALAAAGVTQATANVSPSPEVPGADERSGGMAARSSKVASSAGAG